MPRRPDQELENSRSADTRSFIDHLNSQNERSEEISACQCNSCNSESPISDHPLPPSDKKRDSLVCCVHGRPCKFAQKSSSVQIASRGLGAVERAVKPNPDMISKTRAQIEPTDRGSRSDLDASARPYTRKPQLRDDDTSVGSSDSFESVIEEPQVEK